MLKLEPPDTYYLSAAIGWLELGDRTEAWAELGRIRPAFQKSPEVLEVTWLLNASEQDWPAALITARALMENEPALSAGWLHQAYALRRVPGGGLQAAWDALLPVAERFPKEATIPYNLSCYACQLGRLDHARHWLRTALRIGNKAHIKLMALADTDLQSLWTEIKDW